MSNSEETALPGVLISSAPSAIIVVFSPPIRMPLPSIQRVVFTEVSYSTTAGAPTKQHRLPENAGEEIVRLQYFGFTSVSLLKGFANHCVISGAEPPPHSLPFGPTARN